jgi:hypothetical protein
MISEMRSLIGSIGYCATSVRFDISHAVSVLSRHLARPCVKVIEAAKRLADVLTKAVPLATFGGCADKGGAFGYIPEAF